MSAAKSEASASQTTVEQGSEQSLLEQIVAQGRFNRDSATLERGRDMV